jgi:hypothetical protein
MQEFAPFLPLVGAVLALLCLVAAFGAGRRVRLVENLPTSKTTGVFIGLVELKGMAESGRPLTSYLAEEPCVDYQWHIEEHWSRTVTETDTDSQGKTQTRTREESGWTKVAHGGETQAFYLEDDCGLILVRPAGAQLERVSMLDESCTPGDALYYDKGPEESISNSDYRRRFVEVGIPLHAPLFVMGQARERKDMVAPEIAHDRNAPMFLISTRTEQQIEFGLKWGGRGWTFLGLVLVVGSLLWRDGALGQALETRVPVYIGAGLGYLVVAWLLWVWMVFNSLVDVRQRVRQAWSLVDIQLKRRHELIPNLVATVKGYRDYEQQLQTELAALRSELVATPPGVAGPDYTALTKVTAAIVERYPDLKANTTFQALQASLVETEQRIALARGYFNDIATHYNTRLESVPEKFVARLGAMKPQPLMAANDFERAPVRLEAEGAETVA